MALCVLLVGAASAQARKSLRGSNHGYTLVVPGNDVIDGPVTLTITATAARHNRLVPWRIDCKPGRTPTQRLVTIAALSNGVRTLHGRAQSLGLVPGDRCTIKRRSAVIRRITLR